MHASGDCGLGYTQLFNSKHVHTIKLPFFQKHERIHLPCYMYMYVRTTTAPNFVFRSSFIHQASRLSSLHIAVFPRVSYQHSLSISNMDYVPFKVTNRSNVNYIVNSHSFSQTLTTNTEHCMFDHRHGAYCFY